MAAKVLDGGGGIDGWGADFVAAVEWVIRMRRYYDNKSDNFAGTNVRIMNISLDCDEYTAPSTFPCGNQPSTEGTDPWAQVVNEAARNDILPVVAASNSGPERFRLGTPAVAARAITVGSMSFEGETKYNDPAQAETDGLHLSGYSSRGPVLRRTIHSRTTKKPDILAPGSHIEAARISHPGPAQLVANTEDEDAYYEPGDGTSFAAPYVAGVAYLMLQANPDLSARSIKLALLATAEDWGAPGRDIDHGLGRMRPFSAVTRALELAGSPLTGTTPSPVESVHISSAGTNGADSLGRVRIRKGRRFDIPFTTSSRFNEVAFNAIYQGRRARSGIPLWSVDLYGSDQDLPCSKMAVDANWISQGSDYSWIDERLETVFESRRQYTVSAEEGHRRYCVRLTADATIRVTWDWSELTF